MSEPRGAIAYFNASFDWQPHLSIATLSLVLEGHGHPAGLGEAASINTPDECFEWIGASGGAWYTGAIDGSNPIKQLHLWIALAPGRASRRTVDSFSSAESGIHEGSVRILLGRRGNAVSPLPFVDSLGLDYFDVTLKAGDRWVYQPPRDHLLGWIATYSGSLLTPDPVKGGELAVFDRSDTAIAVEAIADSRFLLGSAIPYPHDPMPAYYSVPTSAAASRGSQREIARVGRLLRKQGVLP